MAVRVKICGVTRAQDGAIACELGADLIGLNFWPGSPRCVSMAQARELKEAVANRAKLVGVFVNADRGYIEKVLGEVALDLIQFHGDEDNEALEGWTVPVIRAVRIRQGAALPSLDAIPADYLLIDSFDPVLFGGAGRAVELDSIRQMDLRRVFVAGGLNPGNVADIAALNPFGVDVASGVESAPGVKDHSKLRSFILNAKSSR
jgi:phosphoribosylanthranilate isomerase